MSFYRHRWMPSLYNLVVSCSDESRNLCCCRKLNLLLQASMQKPDCGLNNLSYFDNVCMSVSSFGPSVRQLTQTCHQMGLLENGAPPKTPQNRNFSRKMMIIKWFWDPPFWDMFFANISPPKSPQVDYIYMCVYAISPTNIPCMDGELATFWREVLGPTTFQTVLSNGAAEGLPWNALRSIGWSDLEARVLKKSKDSAEGINSSAWHFHQGMVSKKCVQCLPTIWKYKGMWNANIHIYICVFNIAQLLNTAFACKLV